jgi:hypothetical protein
MQNANAAIALAKPLAVNVKGREAKKAPDCAGASKSLGFDETTPRGISGITL